MKNSLLILITLIIFLGTFLLVKADDCFLFNGTYVGSATITTTKESRPLFFVIANKHITGFFAPEDQTHPGGASINQTELSGTSYTLSLTADDKILVKYAGGSTTLDGKAKLIEVKNASGAFNGYYTGNSGDFLNVGNDGGALVRVTAGMDFVFSFGKINNSGKFVQVFPENGPQININISGDANLNVLTNSGFFASTMKKDTSSTCGINLPSSSSSGSSSSISSSSGGSIFSTNFKNALSDSLKAEKTLYDFYTEAGNDSDSSTRADPKYNKPRLKALNKIKDIVKRIKSALKAPSIVCNELLKKQIDNLSTAYGNLRTILCGSTPPPGYEKYDPCKEGTLNGDNLSKISNSQSTLESLSAVDDDGNGTADVCEENIN